VRVLPPVEETVFSNFVKGFDDGILYVGLVGFKLCPSSDVQKRTHFGKWIFSVHRGMDDNLCYIFDKFLSD
jgi:hypothetical protein